MRAILRNSSLTPLQAVILQLIWSNSAMTADEVRCALRPKYELKDSSVRTLLRRLESRGLLRHISEGVTFVYNPGPSPDVLGIDATREIIRVFFQGSAEAFLRAFLKHRVMSRTNVRNVLASSPASDVSRKTRSR